MIAADVDRGAAVYSTIATKPIRQHICCIEIGQTTDPIHRLMREASRIPSDVSVKPPTASH
jgi:hypothetical protein